MPEQRDPVVTGIKRTGRSPFIQVSLSDGRVLELHEEVFLQRSLHEGLIVKPALVKALLDADCKVRAREVALRFLSYRARSVREVERRLGREGFPEQVIREVVHRLQETGLLDDRHFARLWVRDKMHRGPYGRVALRHQLHQRGISREIIDAILDEELPEPLERSLAAEAAARAWRRHAKGSPVTRLRKTYSFLARRGFDPDVLRETMEQVQQWLHEERSV